MPNSRPVALFKVSRYNRADRRAWQAADRTGVPHAIVRIRFSGKTVDSPPARQNHSPSGRVPGKGSTFHATNTPGARIAPPGCHHPPCAGSVNPGKADAGDLALFLSQPGLFSWGSHFICTARRCCRPWSAGAGTWDAGTVCRVRPSPHEARLFQPRP